MTSAAVALDGPTEINAAPGEPLIGRCVDGRYTVIAPLGAGSMGRVYRAEQLSLGREVAIKVMGGAEDGTRGRARAIRFMREARLAARLGTHPNATAVLDCGCTHEGMRYLVTELIQGRTLADLVQKVGRLAPERLVPMARQILGVLAAVHAKGIIHRDLKADNLMVTQHANAPDHIKLIDFGIARPPRTPGTPPLTCTGELIGTPAYLAPEMIMGERGDERSDLYSVGVILFELASGRLPFTSPETQTVLAQQVLEAPPPLPPFVPPALASFIGALLAKQPAQRPASAAAAAVLLSACR